APPFDNPGTPGEGPGPSHAFDRWSGERRRNQETIVMKAQSRIRVCLQLGVVLLAATLAGSALATRDDSVTVPFKGESSGVIIATGFDPVAGIAFAHIEGEGHATHFGRLTVSGDVALDVV